VLIALSTYKLMYLLSLSHILLYVPVYVPAAPVAEPWPSVAEHPNRT